MKSTHLIGILDTDGVLHECGPYEHLELAWDIVVEDMGNPEFVTNTLQAETYLQKLGWIVIGSYGVESFTGYFINPDNPNSVERIHLTDAQKVWLEEHYEYMSPKMRLTVDDIFTRDNY